jgi:hypothetical protein
MSINNNLAFPVKMYDNNGMDIQSASVNLNQAKVQEQAAVLVQAKALDTVKEQAVALQKLLASAQPVTDPSLGQKINIIA